MAAGCGDNGATPATIGGTTSGLSGTGLVLRNNGGDDLAISADGSFVFASGVTPGATYEVTIAAQPSSPSQRCTVANGSGIAPASAVTNVTVSCATSTFTIGGSVTGMSGTGLVVENNGSDGLAIAADGTFAFATPLASGSAFAVTVSTQPSNPSQTCTVSGGSGTVGAGDVTTVVIDCAVDRFTLGGVVSGLAGTVVLQNGGGDDITVSANGSFAFPTTLASNTSYAVAVASQPSTPSQTCVVTADTGTVTDADVTSVRVECSTDAFAIGGTVTGLLGSGLVLQNSGGDDRAIAADGSFAFGAAIDSGATFAVTVATQPSSPAQTCVVTGGTGIVGNGDVTSVTVNCTTDRFTVSGTISGLVGTAVLHNSGGDALSVTADGSFSFATTVASGTTYDVTVATQPAMPKQTCVVTAGSGTVTNANIGDVAVTCTTDRFRITGTLGGLAAGQAVVLRESGADDLTVNLDGTFEFATTVPSGSPYAVTVWANPAGPIAQTCDVTNGSGVVGGADVTDVVVTCTTTRFTVRAAVTGVTSGTLVLQNNLADDLPITADGTFAFTTTVASGAPYSVTVNAPPAGLSCRVTAGSGTIGAADVTVNVACLPYCFEFTNDGNENLTDNHWFDACATDPGNTITVVLRDAGDNIVYRASGAKIGAWSAYDFLTSTNATTHGTPPYSYNDQFYSPNHDRMIVLDNGDRLMIPGRWAANQGCGGSLGDGYGIVIYNATPDYINNVKLMVMPYRQMNYNAGQPRSFPGWTASSEITWNGGSTMNTCGSPLPAFAGRFTVTVTP